MRSEAKKETINESKLEFKPQILPSSRKQKKPFMNTKKRTFCVLYSTLATILLVVFSNIRRCHEEIVKEAVYQALTTMDVESKNEIMQRAKSIPSSSLRERHHPIAGLNCKDHGGPFDPSEMVYWDDIPADSKYVSPFHDEEKYITFEPDRGGWNNIRMAYETILVLAHATGRTLVLPPEQEMYLLTDGEGKKSFTFNDFFHLESISREHKGMNIITMEEFLKKKAITGQLTSLPPDNKADWNGQDLDALWKYLRRVGKYPNWDPEKCIAAIPSDKDGNNVKLLKQMMADLQSGKYGPLPDPYVEFINNPVPVDAEPIYRLREMLAGRNELCIYNESLQKEPLLHFKMEFEKDSTESSARMLTHFYAFVFFQDWKQDLFYKRFVRDHIRYVDEIMCAAARIVEAVRERSRNYNHANSEGLYNSWHVRRGDFQYTEVKVDVEQLYKESEEQLKDGSKSLYIATDEHNKTFFEHGPLRQNYDVMFLDDFMHLIEGMNPNYYGMLDQLVAARGEVFFGTWFSTLSGYINRMRGYYSTKNKSEGYELGTIQSYYFFPHDIKFDMLQYRAIREAIWMREYPTSWRDIDKSLK
ncbi:hypothetical protein CTEN210_12931 [Chaetoceros tenuissimus]|uniref:Uncharacterized protein n=1 Tax=Chaetoceros tenuissimus TaxID=426638 RepID=A0AAD3D4M4_9STRA|nr:hypothetical protein CTEN210_12931 [Chaetoceros tenuissimus]